MNNLEEDKNKDQEEVSEELVDGANKEESPKEEKPKTKSSSKKAKKTETVSNKKPTSTLKLRDPNGEISLMTVKGKRQRKTVEQWLKPYNFRLLTEDSQKFITRGRTALQIEEDQQKED